MKPRARWALGAVATVALAAMATPVVQTAQLRSWGEALYTGQAPLEANLRGHAEALPDHAARCTNCHEGTQAIGPALHTGWLTQAQARRGGPPSRYDEAAFCQLLRQGLDPAQVLLPRAMPRYTISQEECAALWAHLSTR